MSFGMKVKGCEDCLFRADSDWCTHPAGSVKLSLEEYAYSFSAARHPADCPLLKGPITVELE